MEAENVRFLKKPQVANLVARRVTANTRAIRVLTSLNNWRCPKCGAPAPTVRATSGHLRYVRCVACGHLGKVNISE